MPRVSGILAGVTMTLLVLCLGSEDGRRLALCLSRLLLHVQYGDFDAIGQPPGCTYYIVPSFRLADSAREKWIARAELDPDRFMMILGPRPFTRVIPRIDTFDGHPAQQWAALRVVKAAISEVVSPKAPEAYLHRALEFVERAREAHPNNGALWLAEGVLYAELGHDEIAIDMFEEAGRHPQWDCQPGMYRRVCELLVAEGMLPLDAAIDAESAAYCAGMELDSGARWTIDRMAGRAIRDENLFRFERLLHAVADMGACRWTGLHAVNRLRFFPVFSCGAAAYAAQDIEPDNEDPFLADCSPTELQENAFREYACSIVGPALTNQLLPTRDEAKAYHDALAIVRFEYGRDFNWNFAMADILGNISLLGLSVCLNLAFFSMTLVRSERKFGDANTAFRIRWRRVIVVVPLCIWLLQSAMLHRLQPIGLSSGPTKEPPLFAVSIFLGVLFSGVALWVFVKCKNRCSQANWIMLAISFTLACILACSHYRAELTEVSNAFARQPMTQEFQHWYED
ncbi:MAG: hypothetical protein H6818_09205 [Phycisphaerales bacterium]|nr:hypothetical protein [Phycisphaerales bacterium]